MKLKLLSLLLAATTLLTLTACGSETSKTNSDSNEANVSNESVSMNFGSNEIVDSDGPVPEFYEFVGEWKTTDKVNVVTINLNPNMTMTCNDKTTKLEQTAPYKFSLKTPLEIEYFGNVMEFDTITFYVNERGLYEFHISVMRDSAIGYMFTYFRTNDYQKIDLTLENYSEYVKLEPYSECKRENFGDKYDAASGVKVKAKADYIYDLAITYNGKSISQTITFMPRPDMGDITSSVPCTETIKAEEPFSTDSSTAYRDRIIICTEKYFASGEVEAQFVEVDEFTAVNGVAYVFEKLPANDPDHVHVYDSDPCFDEEGNTWTECECGEKSFVTKSNEN